MNKENKSKNINLASGDIKLSHLLPSYRSSHDLDINKRFLIGHNKKQILKDLEFGFRADWAASMPPTYKTPPNFFAPGGIHRARERFSEEVKKGRMLGGFGWSKHVVEKFLGRPVYVIPCGAVPKNDDPFGRLIHNYSHPSAKHNSVNSALVNTSVKYMAFKARVKCLARVDWYIKADLKNGYRQLPVHPTDWYTQVYCLGPNEYYIDLNMPFGKSNSSKVFCRWSSAWCRSFQHHFENAYSLPISLSVYVDDFFGGPIRTESISRDETKGKMLLECLIEIGKITNTHMNVRKCKGPARRMELIGILFDSIKKSLFFGRTKVSEIRSSPKTTPTRKIFVVEEFREVSRKPGVRLMGHPVWSPVHFSYFILHLTKRRV